MFFHNSTLFLCVAYVAILAIFFGPIPEPIRKINEEAELRKKIKTILSEEVNRVAQEVDFHQKIKN